MSTDSFSSRDTLGVDGREYVYYRLGALEAHAPGRLTRLPLSLRVLLENLLRHEDGLAVTADDIRAVAQWDPAAQPLADDWSGVITREEIVAERGRLMLIDARAPERYRGEEELLDPVAGHIPGAFNIPYADNVDANGRFLDKESLERRLALAAGDGVVVNYCGSGVTACHNLLALAVAGRPDALLYPGSWSDWCTSGGEVATHLAGKKRK